MTDTFLNQTGGTQLTAKPKSNTFNTILDTLKYGVGVYTDEQKRKAEADTAAAALKLENLKLQALKEQKAIVDSNNAAKPSLVKSYGLPILITGVVVALGIGTYFYFKKKKA
jgi:hypothetical protein